jgi:hypothetical protein
VVKPTSSQWVAGQRGTALSLSGGSWVSTGPSASYDGLTASVTVMLWVWSPAAAAAPQALVGRQRGSANQNAFSLSLQKNNVVSFSVEDKGLTAPTALPTGKWVHVACTYDGARSIIYLDGVEAARMNITAKIATTNRGITFGGDVNGANVGVGANLFTGRLDEVAIFNRALTAADITALAK